MTGVTRKEALAPRALRIAGAIRFAVVELDKAIAALDDGQEAVAKLCLVSAAQWIDKAAKQ